jgi:ligand-binding SRPBCC domain-containing protein
MWNFRCTRALPVIQCKRIERFERIILALFFRLMTGVGPMNFVKESLIRAAPERVFAFHELPDALQRLTPPWESARVIKPAESLRVGSQAIVETRILFIFKTRWVAQHTAYDPPRMFEDVQLSGPFKTWRHRHIIEAYGSGATLRDEIEYEPPLGLLGRLVAPLLIVPRLRRLFEYRHGVTRQWCEDD